jgi:hypothetical protein
MGSTPTEETFPEKAPLTDPPESAAARRYMDRGRRRRRRRAWNRTWCDAPLGAQVCGGANPCSAQTFWCPTRGIFSFVKAQLHTKKIPKKIIKRTPI